MRERVVVAMSGGVDSSVAAALVVRAGYEAIGIAMRLWEPAGGELAGRSGCCSLDDFLDARRVAHLLGMPFYVMDFRDEFRQAVVAPFVEEYASGRTPNPCARCNRFVKFGALWHRARELGASAIATGHYARLVMEGGEPVLRRAADRGKDQSYFLFSVEGERLRNLLFPVGELTKAEVRETAAALGLPVAAKPESQEVCFAPGRAHGALVAQLAEPGRVRPGWLVDERGKRVGRHDGVHTVTIGQRRGLGLGGGRRQYVIAIDAETAVVRVGSRDALVAAGLEAREANWLVPRLPVPGTRLTVKVRSRHSGAPATVLDVRPEGFRIRADEGLLAVTPGQAAVLYDGDRVVGGGWIARALGPEEVGEG